MQLPRTFDQESVLLMSRVCYDAWWELKTTVPYPSLAAEHAARDLLALSVMQAVSRGERNPGKLRKIALGSGRAAVARSAADGVAPSASNVAQEKTRRLVRA
jgi:hypothetical protein